MMDEKFFIEKPEELTNNFYNQELMKEFKKNFKGKSERIVMEISRKNRHSKKIKKRFNLDNKPKPNENPASGSSKVYEYGPVLKKILNEKKMALLEQPEVVKFLEDIQDKN